jgi:multidrug transporter EmrE-like cation transporter
VIFATHRIRVGEAMGKGHIMRMDSVALIFGSVALSSISQLILKRGMTTQDIQDALNTGAPAEIAYRILASPLVLGGVCCFGLSAFLWLFVLSRVPLSSAYPFVALGIFVTVLAGAIAFAEPISTMKALGVGLIMGGILLVGFGG